MKCVIQIPARYASTLYLGKPLMVLKHPDGSRETPIQMA
jgi:CMP-2-keto-3-deoxyoctulosonic acid synthetase